MAVNRKLVSTVMAFVGTAGPVVAKYLRDHPEITQSVQAAVTKLVAKRISGPPGMLATIAALREQVGYLKQSADDDAEVRRAHAWERNLDNLQHAAELLREGGSRREKKAVKERLMTVRGEILAAFIAEHADDAGDTPQLGR